MITIKKTIHFSRGPAGRRRITVEQPVVETVPAGQIPRISKLMALAIRFDRLIREGKIADQSQLALAAHISQPRMTQIMNLLHLAPDIQEELLFLPPLFEGRSPINEKTLRPLSAKISWAEQRRFWQRLRKAIETTQSIGDAEQRLESRSKKRKTSTNQHCLS